MSRLDEQQVFQWFDIMKNNDELVEIRLIGSNKTASGYFSDANTLIEAIKPYTESYNVYFTLNKVNPACYGREQKDKILLKPKNTTTDAEIVCRDWVLIDLDPKRLSGVCSTKEEATKAYEKGKQVYQYLIDNGFYEPIVVFSSSGIHLYLRCALLNTEENTKLIKRFLEALGMLFSDEYVDVDIKVFNAARISRLVGSYSCKGANNDKERPQRKCRFLHIPEEIKVNEKEYFEKVANLYPEDVKPTRENNYSTEKFDLDSFLEKHNIGVVRIEHITGGKKYILNHCPFNEQHRGKDAVIFQRDSGEIAFHCFHSSCAQYGWKELRLKYEPDAYSKKDYREFQFKQRYYGGMQEPQPFTPVEETEDKGKKWLTSTDIKRKKEQDLVAIPTGYQYLDKVIRGFILGEVTILSGLNGCVDCDTEFFDGTKWKKISDFKQGDKVLQYNQDGTTELVIPQRYIKSECSTLHLMKTKYGVNQCLSDEHNVVYCTSKGNLAKKRMSDLIEQHSGSKYGFNGKFYTTFKYNGCGIDLSDEQIRVMCAVICDGSFTNKFANKKIVRINIKKHRKKERLERLLKEANIPFRKEQYNPKDKEYNTYLFEAPRVEKEFSDYWYNCSNNQLRVIADEILNWDGYVTDKRKSFSTTSKKTADFVQFAFSAIGKRATILIDDRVGTMHSNNVYQYKSVCYHVHICSNNMVSLINVKEKTKIEDYNTKDGYKYCFTVPSGMLVLRREGRINITGNSGKSSWLNSVMLNVIHRGFKVACFSGELTDYNVMKWLAQSAAGKNYVHKVEGSEYAYDVEDRAYDKIMEWLKEKFYLFNNNYGNNFSQVISDLDEVVKKGAQLIVIDNLMALQISNLGGDKNEKQKQFILEVVEFAKRHNVHVVVVCHPRKESGSQTLLRKESIAGSSDLSNAVQNVAIVHRCGEDFCKRASEFFGKEKAEKYMTYNNVVEVCKNRSYGVVDYLVGMYYEVETKRFKNSVAEHLVYGWQSGEQHNMYSQVQQERKVEQKEEMPFEPFDGCDAPF